MKHIFRRRRDRDRMVV